MTIDFADWKPHGGNILHESCANCCYSLEDKGRSDVGDSLNFECHRNPPTIHPGLDEEGIGWRPSISAHGWCGEWRPMPERARVEALEARGREDADAWTGDRLAQLGGHAQQHAKVESMEAAQQQSDGADPPAPATSLVDVVASALAHANGDPMELWRSDAATAVFAVAAWIEHHHPDAILSASGWADILRSEGQADG